MNQIRRSSRRLVTRPVFRLCAHKSAYTTRLDSRERHATLDTYRLIDLDGVPTDQAACATIDKQLLVRMWEMMVKVEETDSLLYMAQRQGKISFYMTCHGEEAAVIASVAALQPQDMIFPQYREQGALMWRGYTLKQMLDQCMGNTNCPAKGRQMAVHYGSKELNCVTVSSPLTTQLP